MTWRLRQLGLIRTPDTGPAGLRSGRCGLWGQQGARGFSASKSLLKLAQRLAKLLNGHSAPARRRENGVEYRVLVHTTCVCTRELCFTCAHVCARCATPRWYCFLITGTEKQKSCFSKKLRVIVTSSVRTSRVQISQMNWYFKERERISPENWLRFIGNFPVEIFIIYLMHIILAASYRNIKKRRSNSKVSSVLKRVVTYCEVYVVARLHSTQDKNACSNIRAMVT